MLLIIDFHTGARSLFDFVPHGKGLIFFNEISCTGMEATILECSRNRLLDHNSYCDHSEDIGVQCQAEEGKE